MLNHASRVSPSVAHAPARDSLAPRCVAPARIAPRHGIRAVRLAVMPATAYPGAESVPTSCDKVASPQGSDAGNGTAGCATAQRAGARCMRCAPGQVGCLRAGTYAGGLRLSHGGARRRAARSCAAIRASRRRSPGACTSRSGSDYVTIADISASTATTRPAQNRCRARTIDANHMTFESDDVTNDHTEICFDVGSSAWGMADSTVDRATTASTTAALLPATNHGARHLRPGRDEHAHRRQH